MSDPFRIFADASPSKQQMLATVWKELYESLAKIDEPKAVRIVHCVTCTPAVAHGSRRVAVARPCRLGPPICARCLARYSSNPVGWYEGLALRPGGWPLDPSKQDDPLPDAARPLPLPRPRAFWER